MEQITKFRNEVSGRCFDNEEEAILSEKKSKEIKEVFAFYDPPDDDSCDFVNGKYCIKRSKEFYDKLIDGIIDMVTKYESWILKSYEKHGGLKKEFVFGYTVLGRFLDDGSSELYRWWEIQANICPVCYREYGQLYYTNNCTHSDLTPSWNKEK